MGVQSGIAHALQQEGDETNHVVRDVLEALKHRQPEERLVVCRHSLGGGYAQVMAVHLLIREVDVAAVRTFGAPHVLVPQREFCGKLHSKLHSITQHWVHDWDPVPRLPLCKSWLVDVLPKLRPEVVMGVRVGIAQREPLRQTYDRTKARMLDKYDVVGKVVLVSLVCDLAFSATQDVVPLRRLLGEKPPGSIMTFSRLCAYHSMEDYLQIARKLTSA